MFSLVLAISSSFNLKSENIPLLVIMTAGLRLLHTQFLYHRLWKSGRMKCIPSAQLFQVFAGMRSSKELGLGWKDVIKLMKM